MNRKIPGLGKFALPMVDVRDCAYAHYLATTSPNVKESQRIIINCTTLWLKDLANILKQNFPDYSVPMKQIPFFIIKLVSFFDSAVKFIMPYWNREIVLDNSKSIEIFGMIYRDIELTIVEGTQSMINCGLIIKK